MVWCSACTVWMLFDFWSFGSTEDEAGFRVEVDHRSEKLGYKIREAQTMKIPYMVVVGDKDMENHTVSIRHRTGEDLGAMSLDAFTALLKEEVDTMAIK